MSIALLSFYVFALLSFTSAAYATTQVSGTISQNTTWNTAGSPYVLTGNVTVAAGITLTIQSGVVVKPQTTGSGLTVNGTLDASGAIFTSYKDDIHGGDTNGDGATTTPAPGDWKYIYFASGSSGALNGCSVLYGGYGVSSGEVYISGSSPTISGSTISSSLKSGIYVSSGSASITNNAVSGNQGDYGIYSASQTLTLSGNTVSDNPHATAVCIPATIGAGVTNNITTTGNQINGMYLTGNITASTTWPASNSPYVRGGSSATMTVPSGATLTIESATVVKYSVGTGDNGAIKVLGELIADGVVFTSFKDDSNGGDTNGDGAASSPAPGDWARIWFSQAGSGSLSNCSLLWGGPPESTAYGELYIDGSGAVNISNSTFAHSSRYGIYVAAGAQPPSISGSVISNNASGGLWSDTPLTTLASNHFENNNGPAAKLPATFGAGVTGNVTTPGNQINGMYLTGNITASTTWPASNSPYVRGGSYATMTISGGATLTIGSGTVVKYSVGTGNNGAIKVLGEFNADGVTFTSFKDDSIGGDTNGDGSASSAAPGDWNNIQFASGSSGEIINSVIRYGGSTPYIGVQAELTIEGASPNISGNAISHSLASAIYVYSGNPSIHYNDIFASATGYYGLDSQAATMDATHNYWGSKHGPKPYGSGNGAHNATVAPWSRIPFTAAGAAYQASLGMNDFCAMCGDPINTATGGFVYQHKDINIPTVGLSLVFERTYNSNDASDGPLGYGWSNTWQISANPLANGNVVILRGDGRQDTFTLNQDGSYTPPPGRHDILTKNQGTYKLVSQDFITYNFDAGNNLASEVSETGQATTFTYNATSKQLTTITEPTGRSLSFTYNAANRIDEITDPQGNTVSFLYSAEGNLTQVTDQNGGVTSFTYDSAHRITSVTDPAGHTSANNTYDAQGKVVSQTDADGHLLGFAYDAPNNRTTMTRQMDPNDSAKDEVTIFYYDSAYRLLRETDPYGKDTLYTYDGGGNRDTVIDRRGVTTRQIYDADGNITDTYKAYGAPEQQHTHITYNSKNHPLTKTDARGYTTTYTYDGSGTYLVAANYPTVTNYDNSTASYTEAFTYNANGTVATHTDKNGDVTSYTYDSHGYPVSETRNTNRPAADQVTIGYTFDSLGRKTQETNGNGNITALQYDNLGHLRYATRQVTDPATNQLVNVTTEYQYDAAGNKTATIDPEGKTTAYGFTPMNRPSQITDAVLNTVQYTYDAAGNKTAAKDSNGNWTNFSFDKNNRLVSTTDPESNTTTNGLDEEGNTIATTDPLGRTITRTYDGLGRITSVTEPDEGGAQRATSYTYDPADNLTATTDPAGHTYSNTFDELSRLKTASDPLTNSVSYRYDGQGNRTRMKDQRGLETSFAYSPSDWLITVTDPLNSATAYDYDSNGNMTRQTDAEGHVTLYAFDELNRITSEKVDAGQGNFLLERSYAYNKAGKLTSDTTGEGAISYSYDDVYNLTAMTDRQNATYSFTYDNNQNQLTAVENATNKTVSFAYNPRGLLSQSTDAYGASESFAYDGAGNLTQRNDSVAGHSFTTTFDHTPRNQVKSVTRGTDTSTFSFDAAGNLTGKTYPNGVTTSFAYDADNRLSSQQAVKDAQTLQSYSQSFDAAGNITQLTENGTLTTNYGYDQLRRLTSENIGGYGNVSYTYDHTGNRLTTDNPTTGHTAFTYNQANQLTQQVNGQDSTGFTYNSGGALTQKTSGADTTTYAYNGLDKLTQAATPTTTVNYAYDALGRRTQRTEASDTTNIHLSAKSDLPDYWSDATGNITASLVRGPDGLTTFTLDPTSSSPYPCYHLFSPHGDTTMITDAQGGSIATTRYDSFGNTTGGVTGLWYGYTGRYERYSDGVTRAIEMGVREYEPVAGRFTSADPLKGTPTDPQQRNRYPYTSNNPLVRYDLDGRMAQPLQQLIDDNQQLNALFPYERQYNFGGGTPVHVEMCSLDFSCVHEEDFPGGIGSIESIDLSVRGCEQGLAFGVLDLEYLGDLKVKVFNKDTRDNRDRYNFDTGGDKHQWFNSPYGFGRNIGTKLGNYHAGPGTPYDIYFDGEGNIAGPRPERSWWDTFLII
ncbi:MAG: DUF6531 domain-containing protein [Thermoleophilia bacterium]